MPTFSVGALLLALGVLLGAFGAHGLEGQVTPERLDTWNTAALYHLVNSAGLTSLGVLNEVSPERVRRGALHLLTAGILIFSGSLYALVLLDIGWLGAITPFGGISLVIAWLWIGLEGFRGKSTASSGSTQ